MKKKIYNTLVGTLLMSFVVFTTSESPFVSDVVISLWLLILVPAALLGLMQLSFYGYHTVKHRNPFYERPAHEDMRVIYVGEEKKKREKKMCPICERPTRCRVSRAPGGHYIHVHRD